MTCLRALTAALLLALPVAAQEGATRLSEAEHAAWTAIGRVNVGGLNRRGSCTGALVAPDLVLTAAHCVPPRALRARNPEPLHFIAGWHRGDYAAHRTASEVHVHPDYVRGRRDGRFLYADIALAVLDEPIPPEEVRPLDLAPMPSFADDIEILAYSNRRNGALSRSGPCVAIALNDDTLGMTCGVESGNSGGPVLRRGDDGWAVVAVAVATRTGSGGFRSFAARASDVLFELAGRDPP